MSVTTSNHDDLEGWLGEPLSQEEADLAASEAVADAAILDLFATVRNAFNGAVLSGRCSRKAIAEKLGVSTSLISRWLVKPSNMTIRSAAKVLYALGEELEFRARKPESQALFYGATTSSNDVRISLYPVSDTTKRYGYGAFTWDVKGASAPNVSVGSSNIVLLPAESWHPMSLIALEVKHVVE